MRVEVLDGLERRRRWSQDDKARIVEETLYAPFGSVDGKCFVKFMPKDRRYAPGGHHLV